MDEYLSHFGKIKNKKLVSEKNKARYQSPHLPFSSFGTSIKLHILQFFKRPLGVVSKGAISYRVPFKKGKTNYFKLINLQ